MRDYSQTWVGKQYGHASPGEPGFDHGIAKGAEVDAVHIKAFNYTVAREQAEAEGMTKDSAERDARIEQILKEMT